MQAFRRSFDGQGRTARRARSRLFSARLRRALHVSARLGLVRLLLGGAALLFRLGLIPPGDAGWALERAERLLRDARRARIR
ncbi:hypothetical protein NFI95_01380 [Acetobacteraceae bacterium KSS8]|uniref:Uncharacterized protein n=1 Tax=Endosaccharibacter trunci TaxID=2812733 RepID=A0ABT1W2L2_9PROT|nr:hypothetical protein [Acetobacteraceae bacterium KSS8]